METSRLDSRLNNTLFNSFLILFRKTNSFLISFLAHVLFLVNSMRVSIILNLCPNAYLYKIIKFKDIGRTNFML